jgi:hypothetical protein
MSQPDLSHSPEEIVKVGSKIIRLDFWSYCDRWRRIRKHSPKDKCDFCHEKFLEYEPIAFVFDKGKPNRLACEECAIELVIGERE